MKPNIRLCQRKTDKQSELLLACLPPLLRRLYASRGILNIDEIDRRIKNILPWQQFSGIERAVSMLYEAFLEEIKIIIIGDFDVDGATSTALSILSLQALGYNNVIYLMPNRFEDGYGLSPKIVENAHSRNAQMIMTVDNGISSHDGVDRAQELGISVLITDHHLPGNTLPNAEAIINPNLPNCSFPSKSLAGVGVVFYLMLALRAFLYRKKWFEKRNIAIPNLTKYLDLVALGTIADVVPLDGNNRILTWQGLSRIRAGKCCYGITALLEIANRNQKNLSANDLGFALGPRLNAAGRLDDMSIGVALLICENRSEARKLAHELDILNKARKKIERKMRVEAFTLYKTSESSKIEGKLSGGIVMYHANWHQGVIGILASRIKEQFHRPVIIFAPAGNGMLKGSGRSVCGLHIRDMLERINITYPNLIFRFGGHAMAVGLLIKKENFKDFKYCFEKLVIDQLGTSSPQNEIISDGPLLPHEMTIEVAQMIRDAGPWGHMFPEPTFDGQFYLLQQQLINRQHLKVIVKPISGRPILNGIAFNIDTTLWPDSSARKVELVYKLDINEFRGNQNLQIIINNIWSI